MMLTTLSFIWQRLEVAWSRRFRNVVEGEGQTFYWMDVSRALHCQDLGEEEVWVASDEYRLALADPLKDVAGGIVEYFNREHWEDIRRFCSVYAGLEDAEVEEASMTWVDRLGIDMQVLLRDSQKIQEVRVPFMRESEGEEGWCPEEEASFISRAFFSYATSLIRLGNRKVLMIEDLWAVSKQDRAEVVAARFDEAWAFEEKKDKPSLARALFRAFGKTFILGGLVKLVYDVLQFSSPVILQEILKYLKLRHRPFSTGAGLSLLLLLSSVVQSIFVHNYFQIVMRVGLHIRTAIISRVYRKALNLSLLAKQDTSTGEIVNLQSNDAEKLCNLVTYLHVFWSGPLQILGAMGLLFYVIGIIPALAGLVVMVLLLPFNAILLRFLTKVRKRLIAATDQRVKLVTEVINGIKAIKLYAWEEPFRHRIEGLRNKEVSEIRTTIIYGSVEEFIFVVCPTLVAVSSLATYTTLGHALDPNVAFPALALFNILRLDLFLTSVAYKSANSFLQARVSVARLEKFLKLPEATPIQPSSAVREGTIAVKEASFTWSLDLEDAKEAQTPTLRDIDLDVQPGVLIIVIGEVGSGKSSLLAAALGEMHKLAGEIFENGSIAYTAQDPWIRNATLKENIIMGRPFSQSKYERVIAACALAEDLKTLPGGENAEIGEKGINLSGGQKHRVALARAVYADADVYLLDDPLSAVDAHVGRHLFDNCINGELSKKTRILVTHQLQYIEAAMWVIVMRQGSIVGQGTVEDIRGMALDLDLDFLDTSSEDEDEDKEKEADDVVDASNGRLTLSAEAAPDIGAARSTIGSNTAANMAEASDDAPGEAVAGSMIQGLAQRPQRKGDLSAAETSDQVPLLDNDASPTYGSLNGTVKPSSDRKVKRQLSRRSSRSQSGSRRASMDERREAQATKAADSSLIKEEHRAIGKVQRKVYYAYLKAWGKGYVMAFFVLFVFIAAQSMKVANDTWLAVWTAGIQKHAESATFYLAVYAITAILTAVLVWLRSLLLAYGTVAAAKNLHNQLLSRTLRLPMSFFDSQPTGRLLNRFTRDTEQVDLNLPDTMLSYLSCLFQVVFALGIIIYVTPLFAIPMIPLAFIYRSVENFYITTSRELKRLDSLARSPIFAHFGETVQGLVTIRAFRLQDTFVKLNNELLNTSTRAYYATITANRWLGLRLELLGALCIFATAFFAVAAHHPNAGFAGLALTSAFSITGFMNWMVRMNAELEQQMNSVERVLEYTVLPTEAPAIVPDHRPLPHWPWSGEIVAQNVVVRYRAELEPVLRGLSFSVKGGEKVGICGRTGCGKTTLMMALYRLVELSSGRILIDSLDVSKIGLLDLRSRLALVPQDPIIFSGTIRMNLDPFGQSQGDKQLWEALRRSGMFETVSGLPDKLDAGLTEGGSNLSTGQRQLLCMARALLRNSKILVLDEATSNVDSATDAAIQTTIREAFKDCTVLTIAHRLHTIIDSDKVMLLDQGLVVECDSPARLLGDSSSRFAGFVNQAMPRQAAAMKRAASREASLRDLTDLSEK
eukprot:SM000113S24057  [mRNA]  locus=s113:209143:220544:+ [translate_table: standard]